MEASLPDPRGSLGSSPYADPREVEHPLKAIATLNVAKLAWVQPRLMHPAYELWGNESVAATLRFRDLQHRAALAAAAEGVWIIAESARPGEVFTIDAPAGEVAVYRSGQTYDGVFAIRGERVFAWVRRSLRGNVYAFVDSRGEEFIRFESGGDRSGRTTVALALSAVIDPDAALLAVAGQYLTLAASNTRRTWGDQEHGS